MVLSHRFKTEGLAFFKFHFQKKWFVKGRFVSFDRSFMNEVSQVRFIYFFNEILASLKLCINSNTDSDE